MTIAIILGVFSTLIAYVLGRVHGIPDYPLLSCRHGFSDVCDCVDGYMPCKCPRCNCQDYVSKTFAEIKEKEAYNRGIYEGRRIGEQDGRYTRFPSLLEQEKFVKRFNECIKPIEDMKKDLEQEGKLLN